MRRTTPILALLACCAATAAPAADPLSSSYWEAAYLNSAVGSSVSDADDEVEGFRLGANVGLGRYVHFAGEFDQRRYSTTRDSFSGVGLGLHTTHPQYRAFLSATWERWEQDDNDNPDGDFDEEGYGAEVGGRAAVVDNLELYAAYKYFDFGEVGSVDVTGSRYKLGFLLQLSPWWSLVADYRVRELDFEGASSEVTREYDEWSVGFRRYFPTDGDPFKRFGGILTGGDEGGADY